MIRASLKRTAPVADDVGASNGSFNNAISRETSLLLDSAERRAKRLRAIEVEATTTTILEEAECEMVSPDEIPEPETFYHDDDDFEGEGVQTYLSDAESESSMHDQSSSKSGYIVPPLVSPVPLSSSSSFASVPVSNPRQRTINSFFQLNLS